MATIRLSDENDEAQLVMLLRSYASRKRGRRVVVVFDHGQYGHPNNLNGYGVQCVFAKNPDDADSELIRRIRTIQRSHSWQVVTSDRRVAGEARARGITVVPSKAFIQRMLRRDHDDGPMVSQDDKLRDRPLSEAEINEWLRLFGEDPTASDSELTD